MSNKAKLMSPRSLVIAAVLALTACVVDEADVPDNPEVSFPNWSTDSNQTQNVRVTAPEGWSIDYVEYSVDGGDWQEAPKTGPATYSVTVSDLDVGDNVIALRVESSYLSQSQTDLYYDTIEGVAPVFNCEDPEASMLPSSTLIYDSGSEVRTMMGYFGGPDGGHTVTFVLDFTNDWDEDYERAGSIVSYGHNSVSVEFDLAQAWCDASSGDCRLDYGLTVLVDGEELCSNPSFGEILNYDRSRPGWPP
jgi:hypothetical protein